MIYGEALNPNGTRLFHVATNADDKFMYLSVRFSSGSDLSDEDVQVFLQTKGTIIRKGKPGKTVKA